MRSLRRLFSLLVLLLPLSAFAVGAQWFDIPAQSLPKALKLFASQANMQLLYEPDVVSGGNANALVGEYDKRVALERLLKGTGFEVVFTKGNGATIRPVQSAAGAVTTAQVVDASGTVQVAQAETSSPSPAVGEGAPKGADENRSKVQEIIVTATKREERAQDIPMSIAVITNQDIERRGLIGMEDYLRAVPGVNQVDYGNGNNAIVVRGITTSPGGENGVSGAGATVSTYFDETSTTASSGPYGGGIDVRPVDIERIEVLRGPQGTAFGDSSLGGTLRLIPVKPKLDGFGAKVVAAYSNTASEGGDNSMLQGVINIPIVEGRFAVRAVGYRFDESGTYRNVVGVDPAAIARANGWNIGGDVQGFTQDNAGEMRSTGARLAALWRVTDKLDITANFLVQKIEQDGYVGSTPDPIGRFEQIVYPVAPVARLRGERWNASDTNMQLGNLVLNYDLSWATLTSSVSKITSEFNFAGDESRLYSAPFAQLNNNDFDSTAAEIRVASKLEGRFQYLAGVFYQEFESDAHQSIYSPGPPAPNVFGTNPSTEFDLQRQIDQRAVYSEVSYDATDKLTATVGARYFEYGRDERQSRGGGGYGTPLNSPGITTLALEEGDSSFKASLEYKPMTDTLLYALWSQGFRLGRPQAGAVPFRNICDVNNDGIIDGTSTSIESTTEVKSDSLDNFELGGKFSFLERRLSVDVAIYHIDWKGLPASVLIACGSGTRSYLANLASAVSEGAEFQASFRVTDALRVDVGAGYTKAELAQDAPTLPGSPRKGARLPGSPQLNANFAAQYDFSVGGYPAFARADSFYTGEFYADLLETPINKAGEYVKVDARAGVALGNLGVELFVRNLTNKDAYTWYRLGTPGGGQLMRPRTVGLQLSYGF